MNPSRCPSEQYIIEHFDKALANHNFLLYYQPCVRTFSKKVCGMEVLSRWETQENGLLAPGAYIGVLEKHRLIHRLDSYMIENLCSSLRLWINEGRPVVPVSFNLSRLDFTLCDIFKIVEDAVLKNQVPKELLQVEVTESTLADDDGHMKDVLKRFQSAGYQIWMDDFGSGYSSLSVLKDYDFDVVKIDMKFFSDFSIRSKKIIRAVVNMAKEIDMKAQAEGVETIEEYQFLRDIGCENVQGYLFSKPLPYHELIDNLEDDGIQIEAHQERSYYDEISRVNILSPSPFSMDSDKNSESMRGSSIPLGILEVLDNSIHILYANKGFEEELEDLGISPDDEGMNALKSDSGTTKKHLWKMIRDTQHEEEKNFSIVERGSYFTVQTKLIAACENRFAILVTIRNMLRNIDIYRQSQMDTKLRYLYAIYSGVFVVNLPGQSIEILSGPSLGLHASKGSEKRVMPISKMIDEFIYSEDKKDMARRLAEGAVREELDKTGHGFTFWYERVLESPGNYAWQLFVAIFISETEILLCMRYAEQELASLIKKHEIKKGIPHKTAQEAGAQNMPQITKEKLWDTFSLESGYGLFWKDKERRFVGVNQKFLDYYGIDDPAALRGKNDEDMGWHIDPQPFKHDELDVLQKGITVSRIPGNCLVHGVNHSIQATKMPIYDNGRIIGLCGLFWDTDDANGDEERAESSKNRYLDPLTGLLNPEGLQLSIRRYQDSYQLYGQDFAWYCMTIDNYTEISAMHGRDFSMRTLDAVASALRKRFGTSCSIARYIGDTFILVHGFSSQKASDDLVSILGETIRDIHWVGTISCTLYPSIGSASFSEVEDVRALETLAAERMQAQKAEHRRRWAL